MTARVTELRSTFAHGTALDAETVAEMRQVIARLSGQVAGVSGLATAAADNLGLIGRGFRLDGS